MSPFDDPFDFDLPGGGADGDGGAGPAEPVLVRPLCRSRSTASRIRPRRRGDSPR